MLVEQAATGREAIARLAVVQPDVLLVDLGLRARPPIVGRWSTTDSYGHSGVTSALRKRIELWFRLIEPELHLHAAIQ